MSEPAEAANLLEELTDEFDARQEWEEDLRDPQAWWKRKLKKVWETTKGVAGAAILLWIVYDQLPASRDVIKWLAGFIALLVVLSIPGTISRARRRRRRKREFILRELATIQGVLNERLGT
jgi:hypothetical protein